MELGLGVFSSDNAGFGNGVYRADIDDYDGEGSVGWYEMYAKPVLNASYSNDSLGTIYAGLSIVATSTYGDGDIAGFTTDSSDGWESEQAYIGVNTTVLAGIGIDTLDLSVGEQDFSIGDGFLIADGLIVPMVAIGWHRVSLSRKQRLLKLIWARCILMCSI
jgi:hypothetical protein